MLLQKLTLELTKEAQRRGALGLIGQHIGGLMLNKTGEAVQREHILNADGSVIESDLVTFDSKTGLLMPSREHLSMLLPDGITSVEVPDNFFIHPVTCRLLPIEGIVLCFEFYYF